MEHTDIYRYAEESWHQVQTLEANIRSNANSNGIDSMQMRNMDGGFVMLDVLRMKSELLTVLYHLEEDRKLQEAKREMSEAWGDLKKHAHGILNPDEEK